MTALHLFDRAEKLVGTIATEGIGVPALGATIDLNGDWWRVVDHVHVHHDDASSGVIQRYCRLNLIVAKTSRSSVFPTLTPEAHTDETPTD